MSIDELHVAFPKLYKAPAYARPPAPVDPSDRPFDLDELPLLAEQTPEERALTEMALPAMALAAGRSSATAAGAYLTPQRAQVGSAPPMSASRAPSAATLWERSPTGAVTPEPSASASRLAPHPFSLRGLAERLHSRSD